MARRSLNRAATGHAQPFSRPKGARNQLLHTALDQPIHLICTLLGKEEESIGARLSAKECAITETYRQTHVAIATARIATDLFQTAGFEKEAAPNNADYFRGQVPGIGAGCISGGLLTLISWFSTAGAACGVNFDREGQLAKHASAGKPWKTAGKRNRISWKTAGKHTSSGRHL